MLLPARSSFDHTVDGVWWPRSRDLRSELPTVLPSIGLRLQSLENIQFSPVDWTTHARELPSRLGAAITLRHLTTNSGLIVFTGANISIVYALISPDADAAMADAIVAHHFPG